MKLPIRYQSQLLVRRAYKPACRFKPGQRALRLVFRPTRCPIPDLIRDTRQ